MNFKESGKQFQRLLARESLYLCSLTVQVLPWAWLYGFANIVSQAAFFIAAKQRRIALESLDIAFGAQIKKREKAAIAKECFGNMAKSGIELLYILGQPEVSKELVGIEGKGHLDTALAKGKGIIAVSAHFGNFPLALTRLRQEGYKVSVILRRMRDAKVEDFLEKRRSLMGIHSIYSTPRQACVDNSLKALRNNEILFIQLDQNFGTAGVFVDFFGKQAATATGPLVLALRTEAPIIPMFIVRKEHSQGHTIFVEPELAVEKKENTDETIQYNIQKITAVIEKYIRTYPQEWGWIHRRWKSRPSA